MMRRSLLGGAILALIALAAAPRAAQAQDASAFINNLGTQAIQVMGPSVPPAARLQRFRELFGQYFDLPGISQFVLGRYWRVATPPQQQEFMQLFHEYLAQAYSTRLAQYAGEPFHVTGVRQSGDETVVPSQVIRQNGAPVQIDWYLVGGPGNYKITDAYVAGVSMKITQRDEFAAVIQQSGGQIEGLLARLRQKVAAPQ
jgi:phospholipid transport system substrate-binding protein